MAEKENFFVGATLVFALSFSARKKISSYFHPALIFWFFSIKRKERIKIL
jgi:hypothetical protein